MTSPTTSTRLPIKSPTTSGVKRTEDTSDMKILWFGVLPGDGEVQPQTAQKVRKLLLRFVGQRDPARAIVPGNGRLGGDGFPKPTDRQFDAKNEENNLSNMAGRYASSFINDLYKKAEVKDDRYLYF